MKTFEGKLVSQNIKIGIVAARFNEFITSKLLSGAMDGLLRHDAAGGQGRVGELGQGDRGATDVLAADGRGAGRLRHPLAFGDHRDGETVHLVDRDAGGLGHLLDRLATANAGLDVAGRQ